MADSAKLKGVVSEDLKPFYERASQAEERISRLEAALSSRKDTCSGGDQKLSTMVKDLQSKLDEMTAELASERQKVVKLTTDSMKKDYRIRHLVNSVRELEGENS